MHQGVGCAHYLAPNESTSGTAPADEVLLSHLVVCCSVQLFLSDCFDDCRPELPRDKSALSAGIQSSLAGKNADLVLHRQRGCSDG